MHKHHRQFSNHRPVVEKTGETGYGLSEAASALFAVIDAMPPPYNSDQILAAADRLLILATGGLPSS